MGQALKVLIISAKVGAGHLRAAEALEEAFRLRHGDIEVRNIEALQYSNAAFRKSFTSTYNKLASDLPPVWELIYETMEDKAVDSRVKRLAMLFDRLNTRPLLKAVRQFAPDAVICTHYLPAEILGHRLARGKLDGRLFIVLTDFDIHTMWVQEGVEHYFVATEEMAFAMKAKGLGDAGVSVTGIPVHPVFSETFPDRKAMKGKLGLAPGKPAVLVSAGGFGFSNVGEAVSLLAGSADAQFLAVAGRNERLRKAIEKAAAANGGGVIPFGFVDNMHELMAASDFAVTKSGGLTSSECLAMNLPMVIWNPIPGQEERNADYLLENGAALRANSLAHLVFRVKRLLEDRRRLSRMRAAAKRIARPDAAFRIAEEVARRIA
ncbi:MAG: MGDG synthase family glycosyltransferase [Planctomycetota bacterium]|jgi:processive 1,2-diacylglycerol beta-glucosyltransferase